MIVYPPLGLELPRRIFECKQQTRLRQEYLARGETVLTAVTIVKDDGNPYNSAEGMVAAQRKLDAARARGRRSF